MVNTGNKSLPWRRLLVALAAGMMLSMFGLAREVQAAAVPSVQQEDSINTGQDDDEVKGRIEVMPATGLIGQWTIGGELYTTLAETEFDQEEGAFDVGVCVKLHLKDDKTTVREMDSESDSDCTGSDDDDGSDDRSGREIYGLVQTMPISGVVGAWTISNTVYTVTAQTEIKQRFGPIEVGSCVEVELRDDASTVRELQSKRASQCAGADDGSPGIGRGELYARLVSFPPDLIGEWVIGVITMTATADTEFEQRNGPFTKGDYVKAEFRIAADGTFLAREIKTINTRGNDDDDDDGPGRGHGDVRHDGKAFGVIDFVPNPTLGIWQIGGISYTVMISTELNDKRGALIAGQNVKVEYLTDEQDNRTAIEIKAMPERAGGDQGLLKLVGYVKNLPKDGFVGTWTIGGVDFVADNSSRFEEKHGLLALDVFVEAKYLMENGVRRIVKLETHVLPGGGDDDHFGRVDRMDDSLATAAASAGTATWTVGGRSYTVTDATDVNRNITVGSTVIVNSYSTADGAQVATRIDSVTLNNRLYLPSTSK